MQVLDLLFGYAARGPLFFQDGWGDRALCEAVDPQALAERPIDRIRVRMGAEHRENGGLIAEGSFESPEERLPPCARTARFRLLLPRTHLRGVAVHLAASGDQGFSVRLRFAAPLLEHGIGALVLENAFYGARRPANQPRHAVRSISDLHLMAAATFREGRALLSWLRDGRQIPLVGVTGYSMGGNLAAMIGAATPFPCAVVPIAACCSPDSVLRDGVLHHLAAWGAIARGGEVARAREELFTHLSRFSVERLPPPALPAAAIVVGTAGDGIVPPAEMERIARHWGSELRWIPAGHVSCVLRHQGEMRAAVLAAFERLRAALRRRSGHAQRGLQRSSPRARGGRGSAAVRARAPDPEADRRT